MCIYVVYVHIYVYRLSHEYSSTNEIFQDWRVRGGKSSEHE
jgi:hypothetical protein